MNDRGGGSDDASAMSVGIVALDDKAGGGDGGGSVCSDPASEDRGYVGANVRGAVDEEGGGPCRVHASPVGRGGASGDNEVEDIEVP